MSAWYRSAVFYEVPVTSFYDGNGDGSGDFPGLIAKLDYLEWLGIDCIWVLPFYPSPWRDGGYDISDFRDVHPAFGTLEDVRNFLDEAHRRGLRVIADMIMNHTSDAHPWFQEARRPGSPKRDWYVWSDNPDRYSDTRVIFVDTQDSNWHWDEQAQAYYWHRFFEHQPDLNYDNPEVQQEMLDLVRFWLRLGFDGLRLDAIPYLFEREGTNCENLPETHDFVKRVRAMVDAEFGDRILLAEANQPPEDVVAYFGDGDECHMAYHFPLMPRLYIALRQGDAQPVAATLQTTPPIPSSAQWGIFLRNHDELTLEMVTGEERAYMYREYAPDPRMRKNVGIRRRLSPLVEGDRAQVELLHGLLLSLPGSPFLYYGDEIGMGDDYLLEDRDGVRTPMQWEAGPTAGFSEAATGDLYLPVVADSRYAPNVVNVADQRRDPESLLRRVKTLLEVRKQHPAFGTGDFRIVDSPHPAVLAFLRSDPTEQILVVANFGPEPVTVVVDALAAGYHDVTGHGSVNALEPISLEGRGFRWLVAPNK